MTYDWTRLSKEAFENFCNDLMYSEVGLRHIRGDATPGKTDGGFDGEVQGPVPMTGGARSGRWLVQAKSTPYKKIRGSLTGSKSKKSPKKSLITQAKSAGVDQILLMTPTRLTLEERSKLMSIDPSMPTFILDGNELEPMVDRRPWLAAKYFEHPLVHALVPAPEGWVSVGAVAALRYIERPMELEQVRDWLTGQSQVLTVVGDPGMGKSRFVQECCKSLSDVASFFWLKGEAYRAIEELEGLWFEDAQRPLVVVVDDAHRDWETRVEPLLPVVRNRTLHILVVMRSFHLDSVSDRLLLHQFELGPEDIVAVGPLEDSSIELLLRNEATLSEVRAQKWAKAIQGIPLLAAFVVRQAQQQKSLGDPNARAIRRHLGKGFFTQSEQALRSVESVVNDASIWLATLIAVGPIPSDEQRDWQASAAQVAGVPLQVFETLLRRLSDKTAPFERLVSFQATNEVIADFYLETKLRDVGELIIDYARKTVVDAERLDDKLAEIALFDVAPARKYCAERLGSVLGEINCFDLETARRAGLFGRMPLAAPEAALAVIEAFVDSASVWKAKRKAEQGDEGRSPLHDSSELTRALLTVIASPFSTNTEFDRAVAAARAVDTEAGPIHTWMDPFKAPRRVRQRILDWASTKLSQTFASNVALNIAERWGFLRAIEGALMPSRDYLSVEGGDFVQTTRVLGEEDGIHTLAAALLVRAVEAPDPGLRRLVLRRIGDLGGAANLRGGPLSAIIGNVLMNMLDMVASRIENGLETDIGVQVAAQSLSVFNYLANRETPLSAKVAARRVLEAIPRTLEFRAASWVDAPDRSFDSMDEFATRADRQNEPWSWWVDVYIGTSKTDGTWRGFTKTIDEQAAQLNSSEAFEAWLVALDGYGIRPQSNFLRAVAFRRSELLDTMMRAESRRKAVPDAFRPDLLAQWIAQTPDALELLGHEATAVESLSNEEAFQRVEHAWVASRGVAPERAIPMLHGLARHPSPIVRARILDGLGTWSVPDANTRVALTAAVVQNPLDYNLLEVLHRRLIKHPLQWFEDAQTTPVFDALRNAMSDLSFREHFSNDKAGELYWIAIGKDLSAFLKSIEGRLEVGQGSFGWSGFDLGVWRFAMTSADDIARLLTWVRDHSQLVGEYQASMIRGAAARARPDDVVAHIERLMEGTDFVASSGEVEDLLVGLTFSSVPGQWLRYLELRSDEPDFEQVRARFMESAGTIWGYEWSNEPEPPIYTSRKAELARLISRSEGLSPQVVETLAEGLDAVVAECDRVVQRRAERLAPYSEKSRT